MLCPGYLVHPEGLLPDVCDFPLLPAGSPGAWQGLVKGCDTCDLHL